MKEEIQLGRNVSGRSWKNRNQKRASKVIVPAKKHESAKSAWEQRQAENRAKKEMKELQESLVEERRQAAILKKERRLENERRKAENEYKIAQRSAQTLNFNKVGRTMKAMSKKQLRQIKKTRMNTKTGVVEYVPAYSK